MNRWLSRLEKVGDGLETALLVVLLSAMIGLAAWQIIGRNLFDTAFIIGDEVLRMMVLWLTLVGAMAASRADRHISIAVIDRWLKGRALDAARAVTHLFTAVVCGAVAWYSLAFVRLTHEFGDTMMGDVPAWLLQSILPVGFALMTWRHLVLTVRYVAGRGRDSRPA